MTAPAGEAVAVQAEPPEHPVRPPDIESAADVAHRPARRARRGRVIAGLLAVAGILLVVLVALAARRPTTGARAPYDPRSVQPNGTHAITQLLNDRGVAVGFGATGDSRSTVVVLEGDLELADYRRLTGTGAQLVLLGDGGATGVDTVSRIVRTRQPGCSLPVAVSAGAVRAGKAGFAAPSGGGGPDTPVIGPRCYDDSLVTLAGGQVTLLGDGSFLTNEYLAKDGNAALALGLLGQRQKLVWYVPSAPPAVRQGLVSLLPAGVRLAVLQLVIAVIAVALWRGRRLGPVVAEPLPVVVRGAETVEGRARLYRAGKARGTAAGALRAAARARLATRLSLGRDISPQGLVTAVAGRTSRPADAVGALLYGSAVGPVAAQAGRLPGPGVAAESFDIGDDATLVRLVDDLDALEMEVRTL